MILRKKIKALLAQLNEFDRADVYYEIALSKDLNNVGK